MSDPDDLQALFEPRSVAVIGASTDANKAGGRPIHFLQKAGFAGRIVPVNPRAEVVQGLPAVASLAALDGPVDQAIVAVAARQVPAAVDACLDAGVRSINLFSAGFGETGPDGRAVEEALVRRCHAAGARLLGPNSLGLFSPGSGFYGTFATALDGAWPRPGRIAVATQSGAFGSYCLALMDAEGLAFSRFVATGNEADIDVAACIAWLATDDKTEVIVAALEAARDGERLRRALQQARDAGKPVVVMKTGYSAAGRAAAASHTGALAGDAAVYEAVFRQHGAVSVHSIEQMVDATHALAGTARPRGDRVGIITTSGGIGVVLADAVAANGLELPALPAAARTALQEKLPFAVAGNPLDTTAQILSDMSLFAGALDILADAGGYDIVIVYLAHIGRNPAHFDALRAPLLAARRRHPQTLFVLCMLADDALRTELLEAGFLVFPHPERAVAAAAALRRHAAWQGGTPAPATLPPATPLPARLNEHTAARVLAEAGVPMAPARVAASAEAAVAAADALGYPVAVKLLSSDITHKSDIGAVRLGLADGAAVRAAFAAVTDAAARHAPDAGVDGVLVSPMAPDGVETIIGVNTDPVFGPVVMFGLGGVAVELYRDVAFRLAPVDAEAARGMLAETQASALLRGHRGAPVADEAVLIDAIVALSRFAVANADAIGSIDVNPFRVFEHGGYGLDAVIVPAGRRATP